MIRSLGKVDLPISALTSSQTLTGSDSKTVFTNEGASSKPSYTLPSADAGMVISFIVQDADGLRVIAATGDTIRTSGQVSKSAGYIESTAIGSVLTLRCINATEWIAVEISGLWLLERASDTFWVAGGGSWIQYYANQSAGGAGAGTIPATTTRYLGLNNGLGINATETNVHSIQMRACKVLRIKIYITAVPSVGSCVLTLRKNGAGTALSLTVTSGTSIPAWHDFTGGVIDFAEGDTLAVEGVGATTGSTNIPSIVFEVAYL